MDMPVTGGTQSLDVVKLHSKIAVYDKIINY